ncbi:MAG: cation:proton antiporter [Deltaproteobacteria bacterium]|nr:cation:proton antiporter [Deltaproteobacteria bacterium]MBW2051054.1 cation:proton antiporter [Deltaproteobacteria bacterium]MBW2141773.1 cation:proton antiporter [Deltaproteobacteria bacterium]MBW2323197.1 cation:proton antiporter [Deltaproteobacteria bacterium]
MDDPAKTFITLGALFLLGLATDLLGSRTRLPRVTLLLVFGFVIGPSGLNFLSPQDTPWLPIVTNLALVMVGFLLGEKFTLSTLRRQGRLVLWFSISQVAATVMMVLAGLLLIGVRLEVALLLAGIATATDPAATADVIHETKADGTFSRTLLGIVAVDDAWGLIVFSLMLTAVQALSGPSEGLAPLFTGAWEVGGAVLLGIGLGIPMAYLTGRIRPGEPTLVEALGLIFLCAGIAMWLKVSFLLASMVMGSAVANLARHHSRPFHAIEGIEWPLLILFFILAGASLQTESLFHVGLIGLTYIAFRIMGRFLGSLSGGILSQADPLFRRWMGMALLPQAGVALGMALLVIERRPDLGELILPVVISSTVVFEVIGPVFTKLSLVRLKEVH